jgi:hypothetical protein
MFYLDGEKLEKYLIDLIKDYNEELKHGLMLQDQIKIRAQISAFNMILSEIDDGLFSTYVTELNNGIKEE